MQEQQKVIDDLEIFHPKNWRELADAAQLIRVQYQLYVDNGMEDILNVARSNAPQDDPDPVGQAVAVIDFYKDQRQAADIIFLGARAASIECKVGNFSSDQLLDRVEDVIPAGVLLLNFVRAGCELTYVTNQSEKRLASVPGMAELTEEMTNISLEQFFESPQKLARSIAKYTGGTDLSMKDNLTVKPDTVVQIVREEIGILPEPVERLIRGNFNPQAGLK